MQNEEVKSASSKEDPGLTLIECCSSLFLPSFPSSSFFMLEPEQSCNPFDWNPPGFELLFCEKCLAASLPPLGACVCLPGSPPLPFSLGFVLTPRSSLASSKRAPLSLAPSLVLSRAILIHSSGGPPIARSHCPPSGVESSPGFHGKAPLHCGCPHHAQITHICGGHRPLCKHFTSGSLPSQAISTLKEGNMLEGSRSIKKRQVSKRSCCPYGLWTSLADYLHVLKADWQATTLPLCLPESLWSLLMSQDTCMLLLEHAHG